MITKASNCLGSNIIFKELLYFVVVAYIRPDILGGYNIRTQRGYIQ